MNKIFIILKREFLTRVRKKSFIAMTLLGPVFIAAIFIIPLLLEKLEAEQIKHIGIIDESYILGKSIKNKDNLIFSTIENKTIDEVAENFANSGYYAVLFIPKNILQSNTAILYSNSNPDLNIKTYIGKTMEQSLEYAKLAYEGVAVEKILQIKSPVIIGCKKWTKDGQELEVTTSTKIQMGVIFGFVIYLFIFLYGVQVMRGVLEEKSNRIVEVIVSSVKPVQLMIGKIAGVGLVSILQFALWLMLTWTITSTAQVILFPERNIPSSQNPTAQTLGGDDIVTKSIQSIGEEEYAYTVDIFSSIKNVRWGVMLSSFFFYFIFGYLLYGSAFAAIGGALGEDSDTQQFVIPLTLPLFVTLLLIQVITYNPDGPIAFWLSIIPLTSPIAMMARIPFGVPMGQVFISGLLLITFVWFTTYFSAKVYKTGILMYGKKVSYREIFKWLTYKNK